MIIFLSRISGFFQLVCFGLLLAAPSQAAEIGTSSAGKADWAPSRFATIAGRLEPSYVTLGGGYDIANRLKINDIYYEAQIYAHLNWWESLNKPNHAFRLYLPIRLQVRQFRSSSSPVKTPSFNPGLRLFYHHKGWARSETDFNYLSVGFHHYSNGQRGPHYDTVTGEINTENGSFSSDYIETTFYGVSDAGNRSWWPHWYKLNGRFYLTGLTWEAPQTDFYERILLEASTLIFRHGTDFPTELQLTVGHKFGRDFVSPGNAASFGDNFQYAAELSIKPKQWGWQDMSIYLRWDMGYDYYNIYYQKKINRIQVGFVGTVF